jgi:selenoprotein W-related protein
VKPQLVKGSGGRFEVTLGDELIFSKKATGRFPAPGEVARALREKLPASS